jgi:toxin HigB-1
MRALMVWGKVRWESEASRSVVEEVFFTGRSRRIGPRYHKRMSLVLDAMNGAIGARDLAGAFGFHELHGDRAGTYAMTVSGNWRLTFRFERGDVGDVLDVDFEDYH